MPHAAQVVLLNSEIRFYSWKIEIICRLPANHCTVPVKIFTCAYGIEAPNHFKIQTLNAVSSSENFGTEETKFWNWVNGWQTVDFAKMPSRPRPTPSIHSPWFSLDIFVVWTSKRLDICSTAFYPLFCLLVQFTCTIWDIRASGRKITSYWN